VSVPHQKSSLIPWIPVLLLGGIAGWILLTDPSIRDRSLDSRETAGSPHTDSVAPRHVGTGLSGFKASQDPRTALVAPTSPPPASVDRYRHPVQVRSGAPKAGTGGPARSISGEEPDPR